jgi:azurin
MKITASVLILLATMHVQTALAACEFDIEVGDGLWFSMKEMVVESSCKDVTVNLSHTGQLPVNAMGHNWVLSQATDVQRIATDGLPAGVDQGYLKPNDSRVIAATKLIGGGESASVTFSLEGLDPNGDYQYFCSFPGHWAAMKGAFKIN